MLPANQTDWYRGTMTEPFYIATCAGDRQVVGAGLFAARDIAAGEAILTFRGPALTLQEVRRKGPLAANALQIAHDLYLDLEEPGRLLNHSCAPNVGVFADVEVRALREIAVDEELCFDYSTTVGDGWTMRCLCGEPACRGVVRAFLTLPLEIRLPHLVRGSVQRFLVDGCGA